MFNGCFLKNPNIFIYNINNKSYGKKRYDVNKRKSKKRLV